MKNIELNKSDIINIGDVHSFIETQKYLELIVENSGSIQKGESIIITPNGILNSKKKEEIIVMKFYLVIFLIYLLIMILIMNYHLIL